MDAKNTPYPIVHLHYRKGDLIMKEGDYGVSIYKVISGHVRVTQQQGNMDVALATLGPGEVFGEFVFLNKSVETRSASVRAVDDVELEVMHPAALSREYEQMSPILRFITNQTLTRLVRMNKLYAQLLEKKEIAQKQQKDPGEAKRRHFRKDTNLTCVYWPAGGPSKLRLQGRLMDISVGGAAMEVSSRNALNTRHDPGSEFTIQVNLPSGRDMEVVGKVRTIDMNQVPGRIQMGIQFTRITGESKKTLGFFMMS